MVHCAVGSEKKKNEKTNDKRISYARTHIYTQRGLK